VCGNIYVCVVVTILAITYVFTYYYSIDTDFFVFCFRLKGLIQDKEEESAFPCELKMALWT